MMHEFLSRHRDELIERCRIKVAERPLPTATQQKLEHGIPLFLDQLIKTLRVEQGAEPLKSRRVSGSSGGEHAGSSEMGEAAARHGRDLLHAGFTVDQVVHAYGDLCQAITDLAFERQMPMGIDEFRTLNRCLDNVIAVAVTEYFYQHDVAVAKKHSLFANARVGFLASAVRNLLNSAVLALSAIKTGDVGVNGATGAVLDASLVRLRNLVDRSLAEVRITGGMPLHHSLFSLSDFIREIRVSAALEAHVKECGLHVSEVDPELAVDADRDLLSSAVGTLLQNAFDFTSSNADVTLQAYAVADRIHIEVGDACGGLKAGDAEKMFLPFVDGDDESARFDPGLSISRRSIEANQGTLSVRDIPTEGCVFTIDLPRHSMAELTAKA